MKYCVTFNVEGVREEEKFISSVGNFPNLEDYFYMYYGNRIKFCLVGVSKEEIIKFLEDKKDKNFISDFSFSDAEDKLDISKMLACCTRRIAEYLKENVNPITIDGLVNELVELPDINALAYAPLHFICNQLKISYEQEEELRFKIFTNPRYIKGHKQLRSVVVR